MNNIDNTTVDPFTLFRVLNVVKENPNCIEAMADAYSLGQLKSKLWLIKNLPTELGTIFICAGWYGTLASLMFDNCRWKFNKIRSFDIDPSCYKIADAINKPWVIDGWQFKASTLDIHSMTYPTEYTTYRYNGTSQTLVESPDTIINTSCEHIDNFEHWYNNIPDGKTVVLQTNNFFEIEEHINCSNSLNDFAIQTPMSTILYEGELVLDKYTRYMRIGIK